MIAHKGIALPQWGVGQTSLPPETTAEQVVLAPRPYPFQPEDVAGVDIEGRLPEATQASGPVEDIIADALKKNKAD